MFSLLGRVLDAALAPLPLEPARILRFLVVGGLNTLVGYLIFVAIVTLPIPRALAVVVSTVIAVCFNYQSTGKVVFGAGDPAAFKRFIGSYAVLCAVQYVLLEGLIALGFHVYLASAMLLLPMAALAYVIQRRFVFVARPEGKAS